MSYKFYPKLLAILSLFLLIPVHNLYSQAIQWSTYLNSSGSDLAISMINDNVGGIYILGSTGSDSFPVTPGAFQSSLGGATNKLTVTKISAATGQPIWSTYLGGSVERLKTGRIFWDSVSNTINVSANTSSDDYPVVNGNVKTSSAVFCPVFTQFDANSGNALFSTYVFDVATAGQSSGALGHRIEYEKGYAYVFAYDSSFHKAIIAKINLITHQYVYQKQVGGSNGVFEYYSPSVATDFTVNNGEVFFTSATKATDYPVTAGAFQTVYPNGAYAAYFITRLDVSGTIAFSTYAGALDPSVFLVPQLAVNSNEVAFASEFTGDMNVSAGGISFDNLGVGNIGILKLNRDNGAFNYFSYYGAIPDNLFLKDLMYVGDELVLTGNTESPYLPVTSNAIQRFVSYTVYDGIWGGDFFIIHLDAGNQIAYCSYLGGNHAESLATVAISGNDIYFSGTTSSSNFPVTPNAAQPVSKGSLGNSTGELITVKYNTTNRAVTYSSYFGTNVNDSYSKPLITGDDFFIPATAVQTARGSVSNDFAVTPDALQKTMIGSASQSRHQYIAKINSVSGRLKYGSYITGSLAGAGETNTAMAVIGNDIYLCGTTSSNDYPVTAGAFRTVYLGNEDMYVSKISLCQSSFTNDSLLPKTQMVCANGAVGLLTGSVPTLLNVPTLYRNGVAQSQDSLVNLEYQWQKSNDSVNWTNISGAVEKDLSPEPVDVKTYFRRIAKSVFCNNTDTSAVAVVTLNGFTGSKPNAGGVFYSCPGSNVSIGNSAVAGNSYSWQPSLYLNSPNLSAAVFNTTKAGAYTYILAATDLNGCTAKDTATVYNYKADAGPNKVLCADKNTRVGGMPLAGLAGVTYSWSPATGLSCSNCAQPTVNTIGTYVLTVSVPLPAGGNCVTKDTVIIGASTMIANPGGPDLTICAGESATLGTPRVTGYTYNWTPGLFLSSSVNVDQPVFNEFHASILPIYNPINYLLTASNPAGCTITDSVKVRVVYPIAGYGGCRPRQLGRRDLTRGEATYEWVEVVNGIESPVNSGELSSTTISNPVALANPAITTDKTYRLKMTWNGVTCSSSDVTISVTCSCPGIDLRFTSNSGCPNVDGSDSVRMYIENPDPDYVYSWSPSTGLNTNIGTEVKTGVTTSTVYTVTAVNIYDPAMICTNSMKVNFFNTTAPAFHAPDNTICKNDVAVIGLPAVAGLDYYWTASNVPGNILYTVSNPQVTASEDVAYYAHVVDPANGCYANDTVLVHVPNIPIDAGPSRSGCPNGGFTIGTPAAPGFSYLWVPSAGLSNANIAQPTVTANTGIATYNLFVTDPASGCNAQDTIEISFGNSPTLDTIPAPDAYCEGSNSSRRIGNAALSGVTYSWSPGAGLDNPALAQPIASPNVTTTYTVTAAFAGGCTSTATQSVTVTVIPKPTATISVANNCISSQLDVTTNAVSPNFYWYPDTGLSSPYISNPVSTSSIPIVYHLSLYDNATGCTNSTAVADVVPPVSANAGDDKSYCSGNAAPIGTAAASGVSYSWSPTVGLNNPNAAQPSILSNLPAGTYTYTISASSGSCTKTDSVVVKINAHPALNMLSSVTVCKNASVDIGTTPEPGVSYVWTPEYGLSNPYIANPVATVVSTTTYSVVATNIATLCSSTGSVTVTVSNTGAPDVTASANRACLGGSVQLDANVSSPGNYSYEWTPDVYFTTSRFISNPVVAPPVTTAYRVNVTNNANGCANTADATAVVNDTCGLLPLKWLGLKAVLENGKTLLDWTVASEQNNKEFEAERSIDARNWNRLFVTASLGNTVERRNYKGLDFSPYKGVSYYRIKQVDRNGNVTYSNIESIKQEEGSQFVLYPNPTQNVLFYQLMNQGGPVHGKLEIHSADGRMLKMVDVKANSGSISLSDFAAGVYVVRFTDGSNKIENKKIVVQR